MQQSRILTVEFSCPIANTKASPTHEAADLADLKEAEQGLQKIKTNLERKAGTEFGGHKSRAINHIDQAIRNLHQGMAFAEKEEMHEQK